MKIIIQAELSTENVKDGMDQLRPDEMRRIIKAAIAERFHKRVHHNSDYNIGIESERQSKTILNENLSVTVTEI